MTLTAINFVHVNGKWLYIVDWRTVVVVERGNVLHHEKEGGIVRGGVCPGENVRMPYDASADACWHRT